MSTFEDDILTNRVRTPDQDAAATRYVIAHGADDCLAMLGLGGDE